MKVEIKIPSMGESISEATIGEIFKPSGSTVAVDDEVLEIETDKVNQVLYAPQAGVVTLTVSTEDMVQIGQVVGYVEEGEGEVPPPAKKEKVTPVSPTPVPAAAATRISRDAGLASLQSEEVVPTPIEKPAKPTQKKQGERRKRLPKIRQVIAQRLVEGKQKTAMLTTFNEVDMSAVIAMRKKHQEGFQKEHDIRLGFLSFFLKAVVSALGAFPQIHSSIEGTELVEPEYYDISIAVATERGLFVPVVKDCDRLSFASMERTIADLAKRAREGTIAVEELQGGSFTITNGGVFGSLLSTPLLNFPQSAILGLHKIMKRAVVVDDEVVVRSMMYLALSYDHCVVDGKEAVLFLNHIKDMIEDPTQLLLDF